MFNTSRWVKETGIALAIYVVIAITLTLFSPVSIYVFKTLSYPWILLFDFSENPRNVRLLMLYLYGSPALNIIIISFIAAVMRSLTDEKAKDDEENKNYNWVCKSCESINPSLEKFCIECGCPSNASLNEIIKYKK